MLILYEGSVILVRLTSTIDNGYNTVVVSYSDLSLSIYALHLTAVCVTRYGALASSLLIPGTKPSPREQREVTGPASICVNSQA